MAIINICRFWVYMLLDITTDSYGWYITTDTKGIKKIIAPCMNAIYSTMVAILLYYCKFCKTLKLRKFKMNPYDNCVANRM